MTDSLKAAALTSQEALSAQAKEIKELNDKLGAEGVEYKRREAEIEKLKTKLAEAQKAHVIEIEQLKAEHKQLEDNNNVNLAAKEKEIKELNKTLVEEQEQSKKIIKDLMETKDTKITELSKENEVQKNRIEYFTLHQPVLLDCAIYNLEKIQISNRTKAYSKVLNEHLLDENFKEQVASKLRSYKPPDNANFNLHKITTQDIFNDLKPEIDTFIERTALSLATELKINNFYEDDENKKKEQITAINSITDNAISNITFEKKDTNYDSIARVINSLAENIVSDLRNSGLFKDTLDRIEKTIPQIIALEQQTVSRDKIKETTHENINKTSSSGESSLKNVKKGLTLSLETILGKKLTSGSKLAKYIQGMMNEIINNKVLPEIKEVFLKKHVIGMLDERSIYQEVLNKLLKERSSSNSNLDNTLEVLTCLKGYSKESQKKLDQNIPKALKRVNSCTNRQSLKRYKSGIAN